MSKPENDDPRDDEPAEVLGEVTELLRLLDSGEESAFDRVFTLVYDELRVLAHQVRAGKGDLVHPSTLVHEAYGRLRQQRKIPEDSRHFIAIAARAMRRLSVDLYRQRRRHSGSEEQHVDPVQPEGEDVPLDELNDALEELQRLEPRQARVVELRYFAGLTSQEAAEALDISKATADRDWRVARAFLASRVSLD